MILALDFDGVLHHFFPLPGEDDNQHFAFVANFEQAVRSCPSSVEIVISSTWRNKYSLEDIKSNFSHDIAQLIVGVTPVLGSGSAPGARQQEVQAWVDANRPGATWIGVDDMPDLYNSDALVVACADQFKEREMALLVEAVGNPQSYACAHPNTYGAKKSAKM